MSHLLLLAPCCLKDGFFFQGIATGSLLIFQEAKFIDFISRKAMLINNLKNVFHVSF